MAYLPSGDADCESIAVRDCVPLPGWVEQHVARLEYIHLTAIASKKMSLIHPTWCSSTARG